MPVPCRSSGRSSGQSPLSLLAHRLVQGSTHRMPTRSFESPTNGARQTSIHHSAPGSGRSSRDRLKYRCRTNIVQPTQSRTGRSAARRRTAQYSSKHSATRLPSHSAVHSSTQSAIQLACYPASRPLTQSPTRPSSQIPTDSPHHLSSQPASWSLTQSPIHLDIHLPTYLPTHSTTHHRGDSGSHSRSH
jgi:hypothetical protein